MTETSRLQSIESRLIEIAEQQVRTNVLLEALEKRIDEKSEEGRDFRRSTAQTFNGDGSRVGLLTRIDRLEQAHGRQKWLGRTTVGALIALAVSAVWGMFSRSGH